MEETNINLQLYNLTGQISIVDGMARFNGNYSSVLLGAWNGRYVAIKVIKATNGQQVSTVQRKLLREVIVWGSTSHSNIHPFYGVANDHAFGPFGALISPWCSNGDTSQYLSQRGPNMLIAERVNLWKGVIEGVTYLHGCNPPIVHGDLKPVGSSAAEIVNSATFQGNVLIDDAGKPRICDFGLARIFENVQGSGMTTTSDHTGTTRYLSPELVASEESVAPTLSSDVYAMGCLGLEFIYLQTPFSNRPNNPRGHLMILQDLRRGLPPATTPIHHEWPSRRIWPIIVGLWSLDPLCRLSAFTTAQLVKRTALTLPQHIIKRIITFVDAHYSPNFGIYGPPWTTRTQCLSSLCLASRAYCALGTPVLYRHLRLPEGCTAFNISALNYSLNNSVISPLLFNQVTEGYGTYTESLVVETNNSLHPPDAFSTGFHDLLRMMPHLRYLRVADEDLLHSRVHSLTTLEIVYINKPLALDPGTVIQAFSYLQRLYIYSRDSITPSLTSLASSANLFLPHLQTIRLENDSHSLSLSPFLETMSGWRLPSLRHLDIRDWSVTPGADPLITLLQSHGARIRYLCLYHHGLYSDVSQELLADIFSLCANLQSMRVHLPVWPAFDLLSFHPNLEDLRISHGEDGEDGEDKKAFENQNIYLERFASFKRMAPTLLPKLRYALLGGRFSLFRAFFHSGDNYIMVENKRREPYRYFYDRRLEMDGMREE